MLNEELRGRRKSLLFGLASAAFIVPLMATGPALGQDVDDEERQVEEITVTGSRIKRDVFSSTTPIQVLNTEAAQRIGIVSISELLQKSTASSGQQIDGSISTNAGQTNASDRHWC